MTIRICIAVVNTRANVNIKTALVVSFFNKDRRYSIISFSSDSDPQSVTILFAPTQNWLYFSYLSRN